jgi:hypothetical protein
LQDSGFGGRRPASAFYRAGEPADDLAFEEQEEQQRGDDAEGGECENGGGVLRVLRLERGDAERQGEVVLVVENQERQQIAFQLVMKASTATVTRAARESGSRMRQKKTSLLAPSISAASCSSPGIAAIKGRRMMTVIGIEKATCGMITPSGFSSRWSWWSCR